MPRVGKLPAHEQLVNGMLTEFESRIRAMHVQADPAWSSVIDSVRTDLARLPAMKPDALHGFLPQHLNRVMRIVACIQNGEGLAIDLSAARALRSRRAASPQD